MYSDLMESPAKDCFLFNDQSSVYNMAEMNEINNQGSLDYFFNTYYSSVSRYNTGFELAEDCKNMSFSELFDQELFSSQENKDCKLTIKIEKEDSLIPCYTLDDSLDTTDSHSLIKIDENVPSSSSYSKSFAPKRGINRTSIKTNDNRDVQNLISNPFCEDIGINQTSVKVKTSIINHEPKDNNDTNEQNIVGIRVKPCYSENSPNTIDSNNLDNIDDNFLSLLPKCSTPKPQGIIRTSIKSSDNSDVQHLINNPFSETEDLGLHKIPIIKHEPKDANNTIDQNIIKMQVNPFYSHGLQNLNDINNFGLNEVNLSLLPKQLVPKHQSIKVAPPIQIIKNSNNIQHLTNDSFCKTIHLDIDKPSMKFKIPIIKREPKHINDTNVQNTIDSYNLDIGEDLGPKYIKTSIKRANNADVQPPINNYLCNTANLSIDEPLMKIKMVKLEPEDASDTVEQNTVRMQTKSYSQNSQNLVNSYNLKPITDNDLSLLPKHLVSKHQRVKKASTQMTKNSDGKHLINNLICRTVNLGTNKPSIKIKKPIVKLELEDVADTVEQNIVGIEVNPFSSHDSQNVTNRQNFVKLEDNKSSISSESLAPKRQGITKTSIIKNNNSYVRQSNSCKTVDLGINQPLLKLQNPIVECKLENVTNTDEQTNRHNLGTVKSSFSPSDRFVPKRQGITKVYVTQPIYNPVCKSVDLGINQAMTNLKNPIVKSEPEDVNDSYEQQMVGMKVVKIKEVNIDFNDFYCTNLNNIKIENNEVVDSFKKEDIVTSNVISLNDDNYVTTEIKNEVNLETEKKKISWEEFRAKRGNLGLLTSENNSDTPAELYANNDKFAEVIEEFNRNTEEHFIDGKRKTEEKKEKNTAKEISNEEDELQKKRMKIEYIKRIFPSSFASEIAKTSSLMKGSSVEIENESTSDDSVTSNDKTRGKYTDAYEDLGYLKKNDKSQKKDHQTTRAHSSHYSSRSDYVKKSSRSSSISSGSDDYYNRNSGQYSTNARNIIQRPKKKVVYVGQIPIILGKGYLYKRFRKFGIIQSLTLHKKPDFRVYYAFVTYSENSEAERAISHGNNDEMYQLDIRFGERKQAQVPYYDLDDEWLTDWYGYNNQPLAVVSTQQSPEKTSFEEELQEFSKLAQIKKKIKPQVS